MDATNTAAVGGSWSDVLLKGVSALIDSQAQKQFLANEAKYNTENGTAGQAQGLGSLASNPVVLLAGVGVLVLVVVLVLKR